MGKGTIIAKLSKESGFCKKDISQVINLFIEEVNKDTLENGQCVVAGLGTFYRHDRPYSEKKNYLASGGMAIIKEQTMIKFRQHKNLIAKINTKTE